MVRGVRGERINVAFKPRRVTARERDSGDVQHCSGSGLSRQFQRRERRQLGSSCQLIGLIGVRVEHHEEFHEAGRKEPWLTESPSHRSGITDQRQSPLTFVIPVVQGDGEPGEEPHPEDRIIVPEPGQRTLDDVDDVLVNGAVTTDLPESDLAEGRARRRPSARSRWSGGPPQARRR